LRVLIAVVLLLAAMQANASVRLYGEAHLGAGGVRHSDMDFYPSFGSFSAGLFVFENIGVEVFADKTLSPGKRDVFELELSQAAGAAVRFQSPPTRGLQAYVLLGYVDFTVEQQERTANSRRTVVQSFGGVRASVGVQQRLEAINGLLFGVEYRNYHSDAGITVDGLSAGLRIEFQ